MKLFQVSILPFSHLHGCPVYERSSLWTMDYRRKMCRGGQAANLRNCSTRNTSVFSVWPRSIAECEWVSINTRLLYCVLLQAQVMNNYVPLCFFCFIIFQSCFLSLYMQRFAVTAYTRSAGHR